MPLKRTQVQISIFSVPLLGAHEPVLAEDDRINGGRQPVHKRSQAKTSGAAGAAGAESPLRPGAPLPLIPPSPGTGPHDRYDTCDIDHDNQVCEGRC